MKKIIWLIMFIVGIQVVLGHGLTGEAQETVSGDYTLTFETKPLYVVTLQKAHLDVIINDAEGKPLSGLNVASEVHSHEIGAEITLQAIEQTPGHYSATHTFTQSGEYEIHVEINGEEAGEFELEVDSFGVSGWIRTGVIVLTLLLFIWFAYRECNKKKEKS